MIKYYITLSEAERASLYAMTSKGKGKATTIQKANVLLASDEAVGRRSETELSAVYHLSVKSVERIRRQFCERGMGLFERQSRKTRSDKKIDGSIEAHILAASCSEPPEGQSRWKLQSIADRVIEPGVIDHIGATSVGVVLKKRDQALARESVGDSAKATCGFCLSDGAGAPSL